VRIEIQTKQSVFQEERMRFKFLAVIALASFIGLSGCRGESNTNVNANKVATPTPVVKTSETAAANTAEISKIEEALKKAGFTDVKVDTTTTPATLRGTVAKGKMQDMVKVAQEAAGKPVKNEVVEK
jgi:hypothetical protein